MRAAGWPLMSRCKYGKTTDKATDDLAPGVPPITAKSQDKPQHMPGCDVCVSFGSSADMLLPDSWRTASPP